VCSVIGQILRRATMQDPSPFLPVFSPHWQSVMLVMPSMARIGRHPNLEEGMCGKALKIGCVLRCTATQGKLPLKDNPSFPNPNIRSQTSHSYL